MKQNGWLYGHLFYNVSRETQIKNKTRKIKYIIV